MMARIRKIEIENYRAIQSFTWFPSPGINCLIGPGDSGKSSNLDAIDLCLTARRNIQFSDTDFWQLNVENPIRIKITLGELADALKSIDTYGRYLGGYDETTGQIDGEPEAHLAGCGKSLARLTLAPFQPAFVGKRAPYQPICGHFTASADRNGPRVSHHHPFSATC